ncbi:MAG TPA: GNAT family N-acetyltransferase [Gemmatimonadaceae bacterium]|nr:GNAT family N-acetyltransferase [Gemmatimonadaceae bacterium]
MPTYELTTDPSRFDVDAIHAFLSRAYWSVDVPKAVIEKAIAHSLCFGVLCDGAQVAFARVITDRSTFAYLADVYVHEAHRGRGLSKRMMDAIVAHPELQGLRRWLLVTRDAHGLYAQYGFTPLANPNRMMEIVRADPYGARARGEDASPPSVAPG